MHRSKKQGKALPIIIILVILAAGAWLLLRDSGELPIVATPEQYTVTIANESDAQPLSPGVFVTHTEELSLNVEGEVAPEAYESLAEYGDNQAVVAHVAGLPGVLRVYPINEPILPGESRIITIDAMPGEFLSGIQMAVASNDGFALVDAVRLGEDEVVVSAMNYDNGTEENNDLGSGFDGGQPDPSRGEENVENGTPTDPVAPVALHDQLTDTIMVVTVTPILSDSGRGEDGADNENTAAAADSVEEEKGEGSDEGGAEEADAEAADSGGGTSGGTEDAEE